VAMYIPEDDEKEAEQKEIFQTRVESTKRRKK
jgi:hypothetical protein